MPFSTTVAALVCEKLSEGESLRAICKAQRETDPSFPSEATVRSWVIDDIEGFAAQYARARDIGLDCLADEIREISDTPQSGETETTKEWGTEVKKGDMLEHRKLQVDSRKWYLSKLAPKRYGDKQQVEHSGEIAVTKLADRMRNRAPLA